MTSVSQEHDIASYKADDKIDVAEENKMHDLRVRLATAFNKGDTDLPSNQVRIPPLATVVESVLLRNLLFFNRTGRKLFSTWFVYTSNAAKMGRHPGG